MRLEKEKTLIVWCYSLYPGFPAGSVVKNPPANAGDMGLIPGSERSLEKKMATHSSILAWEIPWTESLVGYSLQSHRRVGHNLATKTKISWGRETKKCPVWAHCDKYNAGYLGTMTLKEWELPDYFSLYDFLEVAFIYAQYPQPFLLFSSPLLPLFYSWNGRQEFG